MPFVCLAPASLSLPHRLFPPPGDGEAIKMSIPCKSGIVVILPLHSCFASFPPCFSFCTRLIRSPFLRNTAWNRTVFFPVVCQDGRGTKWKLTFKEMWKIVHVCERRREKIQRIEIWSHGPKRGIKNQKKVQVGTRSADHSESAGCQGRRRSREKTKFSRKSRADRRQTVAKPGKRQHTTSHTGKSRSKPHGGTIKYRGFVIQVLRVAK